jgi:hypothetical protein
MWVNGRRLRSVGYVFALAIVLFALVAPALAASESFSGELTTSDNSVNLEGNLFSLNEAGLRYYDLYEFTVSEEGSYTIQGTSVNFDISDDAFFALYEGDADPSDPFGGIAFNDKIVDLPMTANLTTCTTYILLVSTYEVEDTGRYEFTISGPSEIGSDPCADAEAGPIAGNLLDGRINRNPAFDVAAPVAVYCNDDGTFDVYAINALSGAGLLVFTSTGNQMAATAPAEQVTLSSEHGVWVYRQADGSFQVHAGYFDGKPYWFSFDTCLPTWTYTTPPA